MHRMTQDQLNERLIVAVANKDFEAYKAAIDRGADVNALDGYGRRSLHWAVINGDLDLAKMLIKNGADVIAKTKWGLTYLHWAAGEGQEAIVKLLLEKGAYVNSKTPDGRTPLHLAISSKHIETANFLKQHGGVSMHTITLPNTITFEELAAKWCAGEWLRQLENDCLFFNALIHFTSQNEIKFYLQEFTLGDNNWELENQEAIACLDLNSRHLMVKPHNSFAYDDLFQPILDYIKEGSHG